MATTTNKYLQDLNAQKAQASGGINAPSSTSTTPKMDAAATTKSFYSNPSTINNFQNNRPVYQQSQALKDAAASLQQMENAKPAEYKSAYGDKIQGMIDSIMNRDAFQYDFSADPLYQQYADQYQRRGQLAMRDAMGQSAALTGGYGNSYAQQVGQQTYQRYLEDLNAIIPQLEGRAYDRYRDAGDTLRANLGMLQGADATDYNRYRDNVDDWRNELDYFYGKFRDMTDDEYNIYLNDSAAWEADRNYWLQRAQEMPVASGSGGGSGKSKGQQEALAKFSESVGRKALVADLSTPVFEAYGNLMKKTKSEQMKK